jgi:hypothetical protein
MRKATLDVSLGWIPFAAFAAAFVEKVGFHDSLSFLDGLPVTSRKRTVE